MTIANDRSVEAGGYSVKTPQVNSTSPVTLYIEKSITLPNNNKVRISFYKSLRFIYGYGSGYGYFGNISIKVDGSAVYSIPLTILSGYSTGAAVDLGWYKFTADLSAYKGQTVTIRIEWQLWSNVAGLYTFSWLDRVVIAGKD
jgi:hypothetical protein